MKTILAATVIALALTAHDTPAQTKPNFSGFWKMNGPKSDFGVVPAPALLERKITHAEPNLTIVEDQDAGLGVQTTTRTYTTDGKGSTFLSSGAEVKGTAVWDGSALVVTSAAEIVMLKFVDRMTLSADGKTMTSTIRLSAGQDDLDLKVVFEKQ